MQLTFTLTIAGMLLVISRFGYPVWRGRGKRLTALLLEIFDVGESDGGHHRDAPSQFLPLFYAVDHPFEQLFGVSLELLFRTWREMEVRWCWCLCCVVLDARLLSVLCCLTVARTHTPAILRRHCCDCSHWTSCISTLFPFCSSITCNSRIKADILVASSSLNCASFA